MPGNYELGNPDSNERGQVLCKLCWEREQVRNVDSLDTVWVSSDGWLMAWWLCRSHSKETESGSAKSIRFLKSVRGVVRVPALEV